MVVQAILKAIKIQHHLPHHHPLLLHLNQRRKRVRRSIEVKVETEKVETVKVEAEVVVGAEVVAVVVAVIV